MPRVTRQKSQRGGVAVTFALSLVIIVSLVGVGIDVIRVVYARKMMQSALDTAMTAAAAEALGETPGARPDGPAMEATARRFFDANFKLSTAFVPRRDFTPTFQAVGPPENSMKGVVDAEISLSFPKLLGWRTATIPVRLVSVATRPRASPSEIALALDVTGSMNDKWDGSRPAAGEKSKLDDLKAAANGLIDFVMASDDVKVGLVPFTNYVNVGATTRADWLYVPPGYPLAFPDLNCTIVKSGCSMVPDTCTNPDTGVEYSCQKEVCERYDRVCTGYRTVEFTGCVMPRGTTASGPFTPRDDIASPEDPKYVGLVAGACLVPQMTDLTGNRDKTLLKSKVSSLPGVNHGTQGLTFQPNGLIWGWNMLDPAAPFTTSSAATDNTKPKKSIVLVTDGINSAYPRSRADYGGADRGVQNYPQANELTAKTCKKIQDTTDFYIYVVAINDPSATDVQATKTREMLEGCVSPRGKYFPVRNVSDLNNAFKQIGKAFTYNTLVN